MTIGSAASRKSQVDAISAKAMDAEHPKGKLAL